MPHLYALFLFFSSCIWTCFFGSPSARPMDSVDHSGLSEAACSWPGDWAAELPAFFDALGPDLSREPKVLWASGLRDAIRRHYFSGHVDVRYSSSHGLLLYTMGLYSLPRETMENAVYPIEYVLAGTC